MTDLETLRREIDRHGLRRSFTKQLAPRSGYYDRDNLANQPQHPQPTLEALLDDFPAVTLPYYYSGTAPSDTPPEVDRVMISAHVLPLSRKAGLWGVQRWMMDNGAFGRTIRGEGEFSLTEFSAIIRRWRHYGTLEAALAQDRVCTPGTLAVTGQTVQQHQQFALRNFLELREEFEGQQPYIMPVIQGWTPEEYHQHTLDYSPYLQRGAWVAVGSVVARSSEIPVLCAIFEAIKAARGDLRLHALGLWLALQSAQLAQHVYSFDSTSWKQQSKKLDYRDRAAMIDQHRRTIAWEPRW